jgi:hypothetical protein
MRKFIIIILIAFSLLMTILFIREKIENRKLTEQVEGLSDELGAIQYGEQEFNNP